MRPTSTSTSTFLAAVLATRLASPALAADGEADATPGARTVEAGDAERARIVDGEDRQKSKDTRSPPRAGDDLETCRRDADGMRGPERSRFMTQCLKERK